MAYRLGPGCRPIEESSRLTLEDLAIFRGYLQGGELDRLARTYIGGRADLRTAQNIIRKCREVFKALSSDQQHKTASVLLTRRHEHIKSSRNGKTPSFEEFRQQKGDDFFTEAELIQMFNDEYTQSVADERATAARARLIQRQLNAIVDLEPMLLSAPRGSDLLRLWLPTIAESSFKAIKIITVHDLGAFIESTPKTWYRKLPGIGKFAAQHIETWVKEHTIASPPLPCPTLLPAHRLFPAVLDTCSVAIRPFEFLTIPETLAAVRTGPLSKSCKINATNDVEAVYAWLSLYKGRENTFRAYRAQIERFLLWSYVERKQAISQTTPNDCVDYQSFLCNPTPFSTWVGPKSANRLSAEWRPFEGPLAARSISLATAVLKTLFQWLVDVLYLDYNPWKAVPRLPPVDKTAYRALTQTEISIALNSIRPGDTHDRTRISILLCYFLGLRISELAAATIGDIKSIPVENGSEGFFLRVKGKGGRVRLVPIVSDVIKAIEASFETYAPTTYWLELPPSTPLAGKFCNGSLRKVGASTLFKSIKVAFAAASNATKKSPRLKVASPHWLRHSLGWHAANQGVHIEILQDVLGHASLTTTSIYTGAEDALRLKAMETFAKGSVVFSRDEQFR